MGQDAGALAGALERTDDVQQVGVVALLGGRRAEGLEALIGVVQRIDAGAPALVGERRVGNHVIEGLERVAFLELGVSQGVALPYLRRGVAVQDHVHPRQAAGGGVFFLAVEGDPRQRFVGHFQQ